MIRRLYLYVLIFLMQSLLAQDQNNPIADSLKAKEYTYLNKQLVKNKGNSRNTTRYAHAILDKAIADGNNFQKVTAYKVLMHSSTSKLGFAYAEKLLTTAKATEDDTILGAAYLTVGAFYYDNKLETKALDHYIIANAYIAKTDDDYLKYKVKYAIASTKYYLGFYDEAIALYRQCIDYFQKENDMAYLKTLHALGRCYYKIGKLDLSSNCYKNGLDLAKELELKDMQLHFKQSEGLTQYHKGNYRQALELLQVVASHFKQTNDIPSYSITVLYLGKCYWKLGNIPKAVGYFKQLDKIINHKKYVHPDLRENYEYLINYYKSEDNLKMELLHVKKLLKLDKVLIKEYKYLSTKIRKEYDTKQLTSEKDKIEAVMKGNKILYTAIIIILMGTVAVLLIKRARTEKQYRLKYEEFKNRKVVKSDAQQKTEESELNINPELVASILKNIERFESRKKFLDKELGAVKMASIVKTNTKYLSKIIMHSTGKSFIQYLNDLRITHIVELLETQRKYRKYTNKALGEEAGFGSTQIFTQAFKSKMGMSPTYFINQLEKEEHDTT